MFFILSYLFSFPAYSLDCDWWQIKVLEHLVREHQREGYKVSAHERVEHCREKWKNSDKFITFFKNNGPTNWPHKEKFKNWKKKKF